jgi:hypothetical protein
MKLYVISFFQEFYRHSLVLYVRYQELFRHPNREPGHDGCVPQTHGLRLMQRNTRRLSWNRGEIVGNTYRRGFSQSMWMRLTSDYQAFRASGDSRVP